MEKKIFTFEEFLENKEKILKNKDEVIIKNLDKLFNKFLYRGEKEPQEEKIDEIYFSVVDSQEEFEKKYEQIIGESKDKKYGLILNFRKLDFSSLNFRKLDFPYLNLTEIPEIPEISKLIFAEELELKNNGNEKNIEFWDCIFLGKIQLRTFKNNELSFQGCFFSEELELKTKENLESLIFNRCSFRKNLSLKSDNLKKLEFNLCILEKLEIRNSNIENFNFNCIVIKEFKFIINIIKKRLDFSTLEEVENFELKKSKFFGEANLENIKGTKASNFSLNEVIFDSLYLNCNNFKNIQFGKIRTNYLGEIDIQEFSDKKYKILEIFDGKVFNLKNIKENIKSLDDRNIDIYDKETFRGLLNKKRVNLKKTKENIKSLLCMSEIKENTELYLDLTYLQKKYETNLLLEKKVNFLNKIKNILNWLGIKFIEISTKYFTCWKRCLISIIIINIGFAVLFFLIKYDVNQWEKLFECLYFSVITFSTVGYGDISPGTNLLKLLSAFEGLLGIFFTSAFVICLTRKYVK